MLQAHTVALRRNSRNALFMLPMTRILAVVFASLLVTIAAAPPLWAQDVLVRVVARGFPQTVAVRSAGAGDGRLFVVAKDGVIRVLDAGASVPRATPFLDLSSNGSAPPGGLGYFGSGGDERGLLGLAFHPDYANNGYFFVYYTDSNSDARITRYTRSSEDDNVANAASAVTFLRIAEDFNTHNGGEIHFGLDGFLYAASGDGGSGGDPCNRAQTLDPATLTNTGNCTVDANFINSGGNGDSRALLGKMLRINVDQPTPAGSNQLCSAVPVGTAGAGSAMYSIPKSNPFAGGDAQNGCDEILHYGLRNPFRFSIDRVTGDLFIGDVGQAVQEEVSFAGSAQTGLNFGWNRCEGTANFGGGSCATAGFTAPILFYTRSANPNACSVIGGYRYRGAAASLAGKYFFADYCSGQFWIATEGPGGGWTASALPPLPGFATASFGEDSAGELYVGDLRTTVSGSPNNVPLSRIFAQEIFADGFE